MAQTDPNCIFCKIVAGEIPSYPVWESETHLAFLTPFPNTPGHTVVMPKEHILGYVFKADETAVTALFRAARSAATVIDVAFEDVGRTGMIFDGMGVAHLHAQLIPMHGTAEGKTWDDEASSTGYTFSERYVGFITSDNGPEASPEELKKMAAKIRGEAA